MYVRMYVHKYVLVLKKIIIKKKRFLFYRSEIERRKNG